MKNKKIISENFNSNNLNEDKKTKDKSNAQKAIPVLIVTVVALVVILTCVLIAYYQVNKTNKQNANTLEGVYASSYFSMVDNVNNLSVDLSKYSTLSTRQSKLNTMQDMVTDCNYILAGLSTLPISQENVVAATKFFNQVSGVCLAYSQTLNKNQNLTVEQELLFDKIALVLSELKEKFNIQNYGMYDTGFNFVDAGIFDSTGMNELSTSLGNITSEGVDYPSMIFDGPFSANLETRTVKGLPENEISKEDAEDYLKQVVFEGKEIQTEYDKNTDGDIETFDFKISINGIKQYAQISKRGGKLISLSGEVVSADAVLGVDEAVKIAENFANKIGFENMQSVWKEQDKNVLYVNLAPVENDIIYYPDLVKVKIDLTKQMVIGFEATNYALNHIERTPEFLIDEKEAEGVLGFDYEILDKNKAVIRLDGGQEISAYEFHVDRINGEFYYYVNATTNQIAKVLKLVTVKDTQKLI